MNRSGGLRASARPILFKCVFLAITLVLIVALGVTPARAQATTVIQNERSPLDLLAFVPCAAQGEGEWVQLTGSIHILSTTTLDDNGGFHIKFQYQPQGVSGTGLTTGDKYQGVGETSATFNSKLGFETTFINNFRVIGQGPGNDFQIHETFHITVDPSGRVTALVDQVSVECRIPSAAG